MKVLVTANFTEEGITLLQQHMKVDYECWKDSKKIYFGEEFIEKIKHHNADAIIVEVDLVHEDVINACDLKFIGDCRGDPLNVSVETATKKGIPVFITPGRNAKSVADLTIALMLLLLRPIIELNSILHSKTISFESVEDYLNYYEMFRGMELGEKKVGIVGLGAVGFQVAKRLAGFGSEILVYDPYVNETKLKEVKAKNVSLEILVSESDIVTIHCPVNSETIGLIGKEQINKMKKSAILINTARADIVDEDALFEALQEKRIAGAGLDVFREEPLLPDNKFLTLKNVIATPHIGGQTVDVIKHQTNMMVSSIIKFLKGGKPDNIINPEVL